MGWRQPSGGDLLFAYSRFFVDYDVGIIHLTLFLLVSISTLFPQLGGARTHTLSLSLSKLKFVITVEIS